MKIAKIESNPNKIRMVTEQKPPLKGKFLEQLKASQHANLKHENIRNLEEKVGKGVTNFFKSVAIQASI